MIRTKSNRAAMLRRRFFGIAEGLGQAQVEYNAVNGIARFGNTFPGHAGHPDCQVHSGEPHSGIRPTSVLWTPGNLAALEVEERARQRASETMRRDAGYPGSRRGGGPKD